MKRLIYIILCTFTVVAMQSCVYDSTPSGDVSYEDEYIALNFSQSLNVTRAAHNSKEAAVKHLDVLIYAAVGETLMHHERIEVSAPEGIVRTRAQRNDFDVNGEYYVYVIANSGKTGSEFAAMSTRTALVTAFQVDERVHISGESNISGAPTHFLMDGVAYIGATEPPLNSAQPVILNNGVDKEKTILKVNLRRAAAKVVIQLDRTTVGDVESFIEHTGMGYYVRNLPYRTMLLGESSPYPLLRNTDKIVGDYYEWSSDRVVITLYVYSYSWEPSENLSVGTSAVINIPMRYKGVEYNSSYYQLTMSKLDAITGKHGFERNTCYMIKGTINAPGAVNDITPVDISDLSYSIQDWTDVDINVGGSVGPKYLSVNKDTLKMHNVSVDSKTLQFASSSVTSVEVLDAHYYNKYGVKTAYNGAGINVSFTDKLSGKIVVESPIPTNKTVRYFTLRITNADGLVEEVFVEQYPLVYVVNHLSWYSYRKDFGGTTYLNKANSVVSINLDGFNSYGGGSWNGGYTYSTNGASGFFHSKVEVNQTVGSNMNIKGYEWKYSGVDEITTNVGTHNARIYHITVTSTSDEYSIARPRMTGPDSKGLVYTDPGTDNAKLVSPSFMIASRLATITTSGVIRNLNNNQRAEVFKDHCANYVEVVKAPGSDRSKDIVYDDWRLPTEAELKIIMNYQGEKNVNADAIDYLLNAVYYYSASGFVFNDKNDDNNMSPNLETESSKSVRCVRDAY